MSHTGWRALLPATGWLARYPLQSLKADLVAGMTLAAYAIPVSMAYASLAGLHRELSKRDVTMRIVEAHGKVRDLLRAVGLEEQVGYLGRHISIDQAILESDVAVTA